MSLIDCYAVIFSSVLATDDPAYGRAAAEMEELAQTMPGYLGMESYRNGAAGVSISYWASEDAIRHWRAQPKHLDVQAQGRAGWYKSYSLKVARIIRERDFTAPLNPGAT